MRRSQYETNPARVGRVVSVKGDPIKKVRTDEHNFDIYDVIIVGGGTAGCVLAARLSEDSSIRVLLIEAGGSSRNVWFSRIPIAFTMLFHTERIFNLYTEPQVHANNKTKYWPRGKILGGCSSVNAQMAQYGSPSDFDQWATTIGDEAWSWKNFHQYFKKFEKYVPDPDYPLVDPSVKGSEGPVQIGYYSYISPASKEFVKACINVGISFKADFNTSEGTRGVNRVMTYVNEKRTRVSSEIAYLTRDVLARPNLTVLVHTSVTRILFDQDGGRQHAVGVEFAKSRKTFCYTARARKEVILSAGAIHSPQILMLSGVGPAKHLNGLNIPLVQDLQGVGSHLVDHPVVDLYFKNKLGVSVEYLKPRTIPQVLKLLSAGKEYLTKRRGVLTDNFGESAAFCRSDDQTLFPDASSSSYYDSTSGPDSPDLELFTTPVAYKDHGTVLFNGSTFSIHCVLLRPISTGNIRLKSSNPWDTPVIDPKYFEAKDDISKIVRGMRLILKIAQTEPLAPLLVQDDKDPKLDHQLHLKSSEELAEIARDRVETLYHPVGTCRMAPLEDEGVVDSHLRVYGIQGLRVCDASIFPQIVSGHTAGAAFAVAEKLGDLLKEEWMAQA